MRILIVEDDAALARGIVALLRTAGHAVDHVATGEDALMVAADEAYALVVLDVGLPDIDGFSVLQTLRRQRNRVPVMMLTARDALDDRVRGLDHGGERLSTKALCAGGTGGPHPRARAAARTLDLRRREWAVLDALATRAGQIVPRETLQSEVFGYDEPVGPNAIEVNITRLRGKLAPDGPAIRTVRGVGYMLNAH